MDSPEPLPLAERLRLGASGSTLGSISAVVTSDQPTMASAARASASSPSTASLAALLLRVLASNSPAAARKHIASKDCSRVERQRLAKLAGLEAGWVDCDQAIPENVSDVAAAVVEELYSPFWFFRTTIYAAPRKHGARHGCGTGQSPRAMFAQRVATKPLKKQAKTGFWTAANSAEPVPWLPGDPSSTFDAVVHFVQGGLGTGVHIGGGGQVLTCAHVVDARDDTSLDHDAVDQLRVGRQKVVMFPSGRAFIAECASVEESEDGTHDVALLMVGAELAVGTLPLSQGGLPSSCEEDAAEEAAAEDGPLPAAVVATDPFELGDRLFCVGNPSSVDLESLKDGSGIEFDPPTWHASVGLCSGYESPSTAAARDAQAARGRAPTRGERKLVAEAQPVGAVEGTALQHSCWTYWGHSGAPLFNENGCVAGLHSSWNDQTGMRYGQKLQHLQAAVRAAGQPAAVLGAGAGGMKRKRDKR